jgi:hypothetical protein
VSLLLGWPRRRLRQLLAALVDQPEFTGLHEDLLLAGPASGADVVMRIYWH